MSLLSVGYFHSNPYYRPVADTMTNLFIVNKGSIYSKLDKNFSIFKRLVDTSVLYRDILNNLERGITLFLFPDSVLPEQVKNALITLDRADATNLMSCHVIDNPVKVLDGHIYQTKNIGVSVARIKDQLIFIKGGSEQRPNLLNNGDFFPNGSVYVIDQPLIPQL